MTFKLESKLCFKPLTSLSTLSKLCYNSVFMLHIVVPTYKYVNPQFCKFPYIAVLILHFIVITVFFLINLLAVNGRGTDFICFEF